MNEKIKAEVVAEWITESGKHHQWGNIYSEGGAITNPYGKRLEATDNGD